VVAASPVSSDASLRRGQAISEASDLVRRQMVLAQNCEQRIERGMSIAAARIGALRSSYVS